MRSGEEGEDLLLLFHLRRRRRVFLLLLTATITLIKVLVSHRTPQYARHQSLVYGKLRHAIGSDVFGNGDIRTVFNKGVKMRQKGELKGNTGGGDNSVALRLNA